MAIYLDYLFNIVNPFIKYYIWVISSILYFKNQKGQRLGYGRWAF